MALGLAADEAGFPLDAQVPAFALAREEGVARTATRSSLAARLDGGYAVPS